MLKLKVSVVGVALVLGSAQAAVLHVSPCGDDTFGNGASWATAFATIQRANLAALPGDEIWVARGNYSGPIPLAPGVRLIGGFRGTEASLAARHPRRYPTVLSGNNATRVITLAGGTPAAPTVVQDFIIDAGRGIPAGLLASVNCSARIEDCVFRGNLAISPAASLIQAAAIGLSSGVNSVIVNNYFDRNTVVAQNATQTAVGGAISTQGGTHRIEGNMFYRSVLSAQGGGTIGDGAHIRLGAGATYGPVLIHRNTFASGIAGVGAVLSAAVTHPSVQFASNLFEANSSGVRVANGVANVSATHNQWDNTPNAYTNLVPANDVNAPAGLALPAAGGLWITAGSTAQGTGAIIPPVGLVDIDGDASPFGAPDRGADETPGPAPVRGFTLVAQIAGYVGEIRGYPVDVSVGSWTGTVLLNHQGLAYVVPGVLPTNGPYDITVKGYNTLSHVISGVNFSLSGSPVVIAKPCLGDIDGDDAVTIFDYVLLSDSFGKLVCDPTCDDRADLDGDLEISIFDYIILSTNFDIAGPC